MNKKYIVSLMLVAGVLLTGSSVMAKDNWLQALFRGERDVKTQEAKDLKTATRTTPKITPSPANIACVATAVNARESALGTAVSANSSAIQAAYSARASALAAAYTKTTATDIRSGVKAAWDQFNTAIRLAGKNWKTSQNSAWSTFKTAVRACGGSSDTGINDSDNSQKEVSGQ